MIQNLMEQLHLKKITQNGKLNQTQEYTVIINLYLIQNLLEKVHLLLIIFLGRLNH